MTREQEIREMVRGEIWEVLLGVRQYLINTEFAPQPFEEQFDVEKLRDFVNKILALPSLAIVDREAADPRVRVIEGKLNTYFEITWPSINGVKEVPKE